MKTFQHILCATAIVAVLSGFAPSRQLHSLAVVNNIEDTVYLTITLWKGAYFEGQKWDTIAPGDSCVVLRDHYGSSVAWYAYVDNAERTDYQIGDGPVMTPPQSRHEVRVSPEKNGVNANEWKRYNRIDFAPDDTLRVLRFDTPSNCSGVCAGGAGTRHNYKEEFFCERWTIDSLPDGKGVFNSVDTVYDGTWSSGVWNGVFEITTKDGYYEHGVYVNGVRDGKFIVRKPNRDRYEIVFEKGIRRHQIMWIDGVRSENSFDENGDPIAIDPPEKPTRERIERTRVFNRKH